MKARRTDGFPSLAEFDAALHRIYAATDPETFVENAVPVLLEITRSQCLGLCANALLPGDPIIAVAFAGQPEAAKWKQVPRTSYHDHPSSRYAATPAPSHALRLTDHFATRADLEATRYYQELLRPLGLKYEVTLLLDTPPGRRLGFSVARSRGDYSDDETELLSRLGPHLKRSFHHAQTLAQFQGSERRAEAWKEVDLTPRETEILRWAATGRTNSGIAQLLGVSSATVKTHLEHIFVKLGVKNRAAAVAALRHLPAPDKN